MNRRPQDGDYAPFYANYINLVEGDAILTSLNNSKANGINILKEIPEDKWLFRYQEGKWTVKEMIVHLIDAERVFAYRALRVGRGDQTPLPGFAENEYVPNSNANQRSIVSIMEEFDAIRGATLALFNNFSTEMWNRRGVASNTPITSLALAYIICGHQIHHFQILKSRYLISI